MTSASDFDRLTPRQRECLALVYHRRTSKEIAAELSLSIGTVNTYISEAIVTLGARNRRHAAEILHEAEGAGDTPEKLKPDISGADGGDPIGIDGGTDSGRRFAPPIRAKGAIGNDLTVLERLGWIVGLAAFISIGFGMLAVGVDVVSRLLGDAG